MKLKIFTLSLSFFFSIQLMSQNVTFSEHIAPIIYSKCTSCHRGGEIGPMPFTNYVETASYSQMIKYVTQIRTMPPWPPNPDFSRFADEKFLTQNEIDLIAQWVDAGSPQGNINLEPPLPEFNDGSQLGEPDLVLTMAQKYMHPGNNQDGYRIFVLPTGLTEDKDIAAVEFRPGNKLITHHCIIAMDTTQTGVIKDAQSPGYGYPGTGGSFNFNPTENNWAQWVPGMTVRKSPNGIGKKLPKNSYLLLETHYGPYPSDEYDSSVVNLFFAQEPIARYIQTMPLINPTTITNGNFVIPANTIRTFESEFTLPFSVSLTAITPHAHLICKDWEVYAIKPNQERINLIEIKDWNFNWQGAYYFKNLVPLPAGTKIFTRSTYDNTAANPYNPNNPPKLITWGQATTDEMFLVYLSFINYQEGDENIDLTGVSDTEESKIQYKKFNLFASYPNPGADWVNIGFSLNETQNLSLKMFDSNGRMVKNIFTNQSFFPGNQMQSVDISDLASGNYYFYLSNGKEVETQIYVVLK